MSLETIISSALVRPAEAPAALVLMGGGARTAYQAGALSALGKLLASRGLAAFPFKILVGTSAGALNASYLASHADQGLEAFDHLARFWQSLRSSQVYELQAPSWIRSGRLAAALFLSRQARAHQALLVNTPLVDTLHRSISLAHIEQALENKTLSALAVTASSYTSGQHVTFYESTHELAPWSRSQRLAVRSRIGVRHLLASSAIPFVFPAMPLDLEQGHEWFGDG